MGRRCCFLPCSLSTLSAQFCATTALVYATLTQDLIIIGLDLRFVCCDDATIFEMPIIATASPAANAAAAAACCTAT